MTEEATPIYIFLSKSSINFDTIVDELDHFFGAHPSEKYVQQIIDITESPEKAAELSVSIIPTVICKEKRYTGKITDEILEEFIATCEPKDPA